MNPVQTASPFNFARKAREAMLLDHFVPDFPPPVLAEAAALSPAPTNTGADCRSLLWSSIDNADTRDLDQAEWAEPLPGGKIRVRVAVADVDSLVKKNSAVDAHARRNATSVYTGGPVFPMLPEHLSLDLSSLRQDADRPAVMIGFVIRDGGDIESADVQVGAMRNRAQLNYTRVMAWLSSANGIHCDAATPPDLCDQLRLQSQASRWLMNMRQKQGALTLGGVESVPIVANNEVKRFAEVRQDQARDIIESFMVAANVSMAQFLREHNSPCLRRVVRSPKRWDRIQALAAAAGTRLPAQPDPRALNDFLARRREEDPDRFPELSLGVLKALGPGEYIVEHPGQEHEGHFGLAVHDYTHSTAPNRRFADLVTQRLLKASLAGDPPPYTEFELAEIAAHCTERESAARHVERYMKKVAAAVMLSPRVGAEFNAMITGVNPLGTFARLLDVPAEGRILHGERGLDIGERIRVRLTGVNIDKGYIDLAQVG